MEHFYHNYQENSMCHETAWKMTAKKRRFSRLWFQDKLKNKTYAKKKYFITKALKIFHKFMSKWNISTTITKKIQFAMKPHGK